jgi:hypothetical protein
MNKISHTSPVNLAEREVVVGVNKINNKIHRQMEVIRLKFVVQ